MIEADDAAEMSREEALRTMATAAGVPEKDQRIARVMLAGPSISFEDEQRLRRMPLRHKPAALAVAVVLAQMDQQADARRAQDQADFRELAGL